MPATRVWGDGFDDDGMFDASSLRHWSELSDGESVRFFPNLVACGDAPAPQVCGRVKARAAALAATGKPADAQDANWLLAMLEERSAPVSRFEMARFAFLTGLHPAYLFEEAACCAEFGATAAWLGELSRRGRAYMLREVAEFLCDALTATERGVALQGNALAWLVPNPGMWAELRRAAVLALTVRSVVVRWRPTPQARGVFVDAVARRAMAFWSRGWPRRAVGRST